MQKSVEIILSALYFLMLKSFKMLNKRPLYQQLPYIIILVNEASFESV